MSIGTTVFGVDFIKHLIKEKNEVALRNYANLIVSEIARPPISKEPQRTEFVVGLKGYADACPKCERPIQAPPHDCAGCERLYLDLFAKTRLKLKQVLDLGFYCSELGKFSLTDDREPL